MERDFSFKNNSAHCIFNPGIKFYLRTALMREKVLVNSPQMNKDPVNSDFKKCRRLR